MFLLCKKISLSDIHTLTEATYNINFKNTYYSVLFNFFAGIREVCRLLFPLSHGLLLLRILCRNWYEFVDKK